LKLVNGQKNKLIKNIADKVGWDVWPKLKKSFNINQLNKNYSLYKVK